MKNDRKWIPGVQLQENNKNSVILQNTSKLNK